MTEHEATLVIQGPRGPILARQKNIVVVPTDDSVPLGDVALAVSLLRWGSPTIQLLFPTKLVCKDKRKDLCDKVGAMCASLAHPKELFVCFHNEQAEGIHSINLEKEEKNGSTHHRH